MTYYIQMLGAYPAGFHHPIQLDDSDESPNQLVPEHHQHVETCECIPKTAVHPSPEEEPLVSDGCSS